MDDDFYAVIKLVSGEEVFGLVSFSEEDGTQYLIISSPAIITKTIDEDGYEYKIEPWMKLTEETLFIIDSSKIITIVKAYDERIMPLYQKFLSVVQFSQSGNYSLKRNEGYIANIQTAKELLEKSFSI